MSALREIRNEWLLDLHPSQVGSSTEFAQRLALPNEYLRGEPVSEQERVLRFWKTFVTKIRQLCKDRCSVLRVPNRRYRKAVFHASMENLCVDFSRRTETLKVRFLVHPKGHNQKKTTYQLKIVRLSDIPAHCRGVQFCTAEIPPAEMQAYATLVNTTSNNTLRMGRHATTIQVEAVPEEAAAIVLSDSMDSTETATVTTIEESEGGLVWSTRSLEDVLPRADGICAQQSASAGSLLPLAQAEEFVQDLQYINPPIAMAVPFHSNK